LVIEDFKASSASVDDFKQWHSVVYKTVLGECESVDSSNSGGMEKGTITQSYWCLWT
jgi:hypothetical protein